MEKRGHHASNGVAQPGCEVVKDNFRPMVGYLSPVFANVFRYLDVAQFEMCGWSVGQMANYQAVWSSVIFINNHDIRVLVGNGILNNLLYGTPFPPKRSCIWNNPSQFFDKGNSSLKKKKNQTKTHL